MVRRIGRVSPGSTDHPYLSHGRIDRMRFFLNPGTEKAGHRFEAVSGRESIGW